MCTLNNREYDLLSAAHNAHPGRLWARSWYYKGEGVLPEKLGGGECGTLPETLTLFQTKICGFPYPTSDLIKNFIPYFRPDP